jgi:hypothetical protein
MFTTELERAAGPELVVSDPEPSADYLWELTCEAMAEEPESLPAGLPAGLDGWLPSLFLAAVLSTMGPEGLSGHDRVIRLKAHQRLASHYQARVYEDMASIQEVMTDLEDGDEQFGFRMASAEIRAALQQTARAANSELRIALDLDDPVYSPVQQALVDGLLDRRRAGLIIHRTSHLDPEVAKTVVSEVMREAAGMTSGEIIARIDELNMSTDPDEANKRQKEGLSQRRVYPEKNWDGTTHYMGLHLPPERVAAAHRRINRIAHQLKTESESRTMDQLRADIYLDLLCGANPDQKTSQRGTVDIRVPPSTLTGESDQPGEIPGWGPVLADTARRIVAENTNGHWQITIIDPTTGRPLAAVSTKRRPTNHQTRQVQAQHPVCVFVGCRNPARDCDLDHNTPWADGGPTTIDKLAPLCPGDHTIRHHGWTYQINRDATITWTSPLGHKYTKRPWRPP